MRNEPPGKDELDPIEIASRDEIAALQLERMRWTLGHAYEPIVRAAYKEMLCGANFSRPAAIELECAEMFLGLIEGAEMVKFAKDGSAATTAALKLARAATGRDLVACCSDHPFFSTNDWFIGTTPMDAGIPHVVSRGQQGAYKM